MRAASAPRRVAQPPSWVFAWRNQRALRGPLRCARPAPASAGLHPSPPRPMRFEALPHTCMTRSHRRMPHMLLSYTSVRGGLLVEFFNQTANMFNLSEVLIILPPILITALASIRD